MFRLTEFRPFVGQGATPPTFPPVRARTMPSISQLIASELNASAAQVEAATRLLDEGATVPFV